MNSVVVQLIAAFFGSLGFAIILKIKGKQIVFSGIGGVVTWGIYLLAYDALGSYFTANFIASVFVAIYAEACARWNRAPATIFLTASAVPLIPGSNLYNMMFGIVSENSKMATENGVTALVIALAIGMGFMVVTVLTRHFLKVRKIAKEVL